MEHPRAPLPPPARLLSFALILLPARSHVHHVPRELRLPRARHELHHQEAARVRLPSHDAPDAHRRRPTVAILPRQEDPQCASPLLLDHGISSLTAFFLRVQNVFFWLSMITGLSMVSFRRFWQIDDA